MKIFMKTMLKKILLISLLFSAAVPSTMQANLDLAALRSGAIEIVSFLRENSIVVGVGVVGIAVFVWKMLKEKAMTDGFFLAVENNNIEEVKQALANGTNVDVQNKYGDTALIRAAYMGYSEIARLLLDNNADVNWLSKQNNNSSRFTALMHAAWHGHSKVVELLLATKEADVNLQDNSSRTALMMAASHGRLEIVKLLLATKKADVDQQDMFGYTALMRAVSWVRYTIGPEKRQKVTNIIEQLLAAGADPLVKAKDGTIVVKLAHDNPEIQKTINEYMRKQTLGPLKEAVAALPGSLELPDELATFISECTY